MTSWPHGADAPHPRVLAVCTANICRSPLVERMINDKMTALGRSVSVASAGFLENGRGPDLTMAELALPLGFDMRGHSSSVVNADLAGAADLVITMERRHAREIIVMDRELAPKVHTFKSLVGAINNASAPGASLAEQLAGIAEARGFSALMGDGGSDEVADPHKRSKRHYRNALAELDHLTTALTQWLSQYA